MRHMSGLWGAGDRTQGLLSSRQTLSQLSHRLSSVHDPQMRISKHVDRPSNPLLCSRRKDQCPSIGL